MDSAITRIDNILIKSKAKYQQKEKGRYQNLEYKCDEWTLVNRS